MQAGGNECIAVIGDGCMTAGIAFEALNHAGFLDSNMIVILNDNQQVTYANFPGRQEAMMLSLRTQSLGALDTHKRCSSISRPRHETVRHSCMGTRIHEILRSRLTCSATGVSANSVQQQRPEAVWGSEQSIGRPVSTQLTAGLQGAG